MKAATEIQRTDPFVGYFASVALALIASGWLARSFVDLLSAVSSLELSNEWRVNMAAGLFLGITFSNIVGSLIAKANFRRSAIRFAIGFALGVLTQFIIFTPFAGHGMSNFLFLLLAGGMVPIVLMVDQVRVFLDKNDVVPAEKLAKLVIRVLSWPTRLLFVMMMGTSFALFWTFAANIGQVLTVLAGVLLMLTISVSLREVEEEDEDEDPEEAERRIWLALEPEELAYVGITEQATGMLRNLLLNLLPAAVLFGGTIQLAIEFLLVVYPDIQANYSDPLSMLQTAGIVAASGLAVIFFGMMAALGICLVVLRIVGYVKNWSDGHLRENYIHLIKLMYFRPMKRM